MGRADVSLKYLFDKHPKRYKLELTSNEGRSETKSYGHLDVVLRWRYNPDLPVNFELAEDGAEGDDDDDEDNEPPPVEVSEEAKEKAAAEAKKALENAENSTKVLSGDYTLYVHMIEARDLKAKDVSGTSDPVVYVEFLGKTVNTAIVPKTLSPVWDDSFIMRYVYYIRAAKQKNFYLTPNPCILITDMLFFICIYVCLACNKRLI
jgi:hypothetical protein